MCWSNHNFNLWLADDIFNCPISRLEVFAFLFAQHQFFENRFHHQKLADFNYVLLFYRNFFYFNSKACLKFDTCFSRWLIWQRCLNSQIYCFVFYCLIQVFYLNIPETFFSPLTLPALLKCKLSLNFFRFVYFNFNQLFAKPTSGYCCWLVHLAQCCRSFRD